MPSLLNVGVAMFLNAFFGMFMVCAGLCINMRHGGHGEARRKEVDSDSDADEGGYSDDEDDQEAGRVRAWDGGKLGRALAAQDASGVEFTEMVRVGGGASSSKYVYNDGSEDEDEGEDFTI